MADSKALTRDEIFMLSVAFNLILAFQIATMIENNKRNKKE